MDAAYLQEFQQAVHGFQAKQQPAPGMALARGQAPNYGDNVMRGWGAPGGPAGLVTSSILQELSDYEEDIVD